MGFDITYHPIKEDEVKEWYFDVLEDESTIDKLAKKYEIEDFYKEKYLDTIKVAKQTDNKEYFDKSHGYYIAIVQGFFRDHFYTRGSAFSFLMQDHQEFKKYTKKWEDILKFEIKNPTHNQIVENYSSGVFIPQKEVENLLNDYEKDENIKNILDNFYSHKRINVFLKALKFAKENGVGLLEATEVVEPEPLDLNKSISYSNLFNCDIEGALLYQEAAMEQIKEIEKRNNLESGTIAKNASYEKIVHKNLENSEEENKDKKKSFWQKLFGK